MTSLDRKNDRVNAVFTSLQVCWLRKHLEGCLSNVARVLDGAVDDRVITRLLADRPSERSCASELSLTRASVTTALGDLRYRGGVVVFHGHGTGLFHASKVTLGDQ